MQIPDPEDDATIPPHAGPKRPDGREQSPPVDDLALERRRLVDVQAVAKVGSWETDPVTLAVSWSRETHRIFGTDPATFQPTHAAFLSKVHPDDRDRVDQAFVESLGRRDTNTIEHRIVLPDGTVKVVEERWQAYDASGEWPARVVGTCQDITERKEALERLRASEERFREIAETIQEVFWITDPVKRTMFYVSPAYERIWGRTCESLYREPANWVEAIHPADRERVCAAVSTRQVTGEYDEIYRIIRPDRSVRWIHDRAFPVRGEDGTVLRIVGTAEDVTARRELEEQYRQSQKMEAIGRLAGGIAHDFNNLLTVIGNHSELILAAQGNPAQVRSSAEAIAGASSRAAGLTRQLLSFSRQSLIQPRVLDLNEVVTDTGAMLRRMIGEDIEFITRLQPGLACVKVDAGQLDQVLMNLVVNARDAMPGGGRLVIGTGEADITPAVAAGRPGCRSGRYVWLAITDNGVGMSAEVRSHMFEPFFTTKPVGRGTGLGLATVYGIVEQGGGFLEVDSEPGQGTSVRVYLPAADEPYVRHEGSAGPAAGGGAETILVVEDDDGMRDVIEAILTRQGYRVFTTQRGEQALEFMATTREPVGLVLTDVVMPGISGPDLARQLRELHPRLRILFMSGYTTDTMVRHGLLDDTVDFIQKPYTLQDLALKVREVLDREGA